MSFFFSFWSDMSFFFWTGRSHTFFFCGPRGGGQPHLCGVGGTGELHSQGSNMVPASFGCTIARTLPLPTDLAFACFPYLCLMFIFRSKFTTHFLFLVEPTSIFWWPTSSIYAMNGVDLGCTLISANQQHKVTPVD